MTAGVVLDIGEVVARYPDFCVALIVTDGLAIAPGSTPAAESFIAATEASVGAYLAGRELGEIAELKAWRDAYKTFGEKKTSYRSSVERLLKAVQRGGRLPRVNALVDLYNAVSALYRMPVGADDVDRVTPPLAFRFARPGDTFFALGGDPPADDPPKPGEVVYADAGKCLCRRWNWYQDGRSAIALSTTRAVLTVQALSTTVDQVNAAAIDLRRLLRDHCGGRADFAIAHRASPQVAVTVI